MLHKIAFTAALAGIVFAQDDIPSSIDLNTIPTVTITDNVVTGSAPATPDVVTATGVACIPESDMVFSIQTDTSIRTGPLTVTPLCGQSVTPTGTETGSMTTQVIITGGGGNITAINNSTVSLTTTLAGTETGLTTLSATDSEPTGSETTGSEAQSATDSSAPASTQSESPAGKVAVGAAAGLLGLAAGVVML
ncbi:hypothetical protein CKM354_000083800 [Cercospora kikuchii]|uniref:GPI anchored protein n=1 Tax=Cercospora kikuchii TaxID=84275 RepID=A0A9P3C728_9PEZI|nr:uncharacterized protein CKM354_000083800 [Cercospora kikuchii]GIZ37391.1 hypothetical protein CKM354_000083800 [Cercospora kikuchii]